MEKFQSIFNVDIVSNTNNNGENAKAWCWCADRKKN